MKKEGTQIMFDMSDDDSFFYDSYEPYNMDGGEFVPNDAPDDFDPFDETYLETPEQVEKVLTELESIKMWYDGNETIYNAIYMLKQYKTMLEKDTQKLKGSSFSGIRSPAYRKDIDEDMVYNLSQQGISLRKIAKQMGCSVDAVKRRIRNKQSKK